MSRHDHRVNFLKGRNALDGSDLTDKFGALGALRFGHGMRIGQNRTNLLGQHAVLGFPLLDGNLDLIQDRQRHGSALHPSVNAPGG